MKNIKKLEHKLRTKIMQDLNNAKTKNNVTCDDCPSAASEAD